MISISHYEEYFPTELAVINLVMSQEILYFSHSVRGRKILGGWKLKVIMIHLDVVWVLAMPGLLERHRCQMQW